MIEACLAGQVIAPSDRTLVLEGNHYFPPEDVEDRFLTRTRMKSLCPWKGIASYYTVDVGTARARDGAWTYRHPSPFARRIKNHVAFWSDVGVHEVDADRDADARPTG